MSDRWGEAGRAAIGGPAPPHGGGANQDVDEQDGQWERVRKTAVTEELRQHGRFFSFQSMEPFRKYQ